VGADSYFAATPAPVDKSGRVVFPTTKKGLKILHQRVDDLSDQVLSACARSVIGQDDAEFARILLHSAVDEMLGDEDAWCQRIDRRRAWVVGGGLSSGEVPENFDSITLLGLSGITDAPLGEDEQAAGSQVLAGKLLSSVLGALGAQLDIWLSASKMGAANRAAVKAEVARSVAADYKGATDAIAVALRTRWGAAMDPEIYDPFDEEDS